jgi:DNA-binding GntR family transcriptional regulator
MERNGSLDLSLRFLPHPGTKSEVAYETVRKLILDGTIRPGTTLNQEGLAQSLAVSITPLREALRRLQAEGFVRIEAHRTVLVADLTINELHQLFDVKLQLDPHAAALAAKSATDAQIAELKRYSSVSPLGTISERLDANRRFHGTLYESSNNKVLASVCLQLWVRSDRYRAIILREERLSNDVLEKQHLEIAEAIESRNVKLATRLVRVHTQEALNIIAESAQMIDGVDGVDSSDPAAAPLIRSY